MKAFFQVDDGLTNPFFIATVEDNNDPTFNYRVKVRIPNIHPNELKTEELPWAARLCNSFMGVGDEQDLNHAIPEVGTQVLVLAIGSNLNSLIYLGNLYKKTPQTPTDNKYLDTYGIYRKDGQFIGVDKIKKLFQMLFDGDIEVDLVHNIKINASETITVNCNTANVTSSGETNVTANGNLNVTAPTSTFNGDIVVTGNATISGDTTISGNEIVSGNTTISGTVHAANYDAHTHVCTAPGAPSGPPSA